MFEQPRNDPAISTPATRRAIILFERGMAINSLDQAEINTASSLRSDDSAPLVISAFGEGNREYSAFFGSQARFQADSARTWAIWKMQDGQGQEHSLKGLRALVLSRMGIFGPSSANRRLMYI